MEVNIPDLRRGIEAHLSYLEQEAARYRDFLQALDGIWPEAANGDRHLPNTPSQDAMAPQVSIFGAPFLQSPPDAPAADGTSHEPTRRELVRKIMYEFEDTFRVNDILEKLAARRPEEDSKNMRHDISRVLRRWVKDGEIELVSKQDSVGGSNVYRVIRNREGNATLGT